MPVLPALRHRAVQPRAGPARGLLRRGGRVGLRPLPSGRPRPGGGRRAPRRWWCGRRPRGPSCPTPASRSTPTSPTPWSTAWSWPRRWSTTVFGEGRVVTHRVPGAGLVGLRYRRPFDDVAVAAGRRRVAGGRRPTTSRPRRAPASSTWPRRSARSTARSAGEHGLPTLNPVGPDGRFTDGRRLAGRAGGPRGQPRRQRPPRRRPAPAAAPALRPLVPALLAVRDAAHLLGQAELVRRHLDPQGRPGGGQPDGRLAPGATSGTAGSASGWPTTSTGRSRGTGSGARRCRSGGARTATSTASARWPSCPSWPGRDVRDIDPHRPAIDEVEFPCPDVPRLARAATGDGGRWPAGSSR